MGFFDFGGRSVSLSSKKPAEDELVSKKDLEEAC